MKAMYVYQTPGTYVLLRGPHLSDWLRDQGIPAVRAPLDRGHKLRREQLPDLLAAAAESHVPVHMRAGDRA